MLAAMQTGRHSVGVEIAPDYVDLAERRLTKEAAQLFSRCSLEVVRWSAEAGEGNATEPRRRVSEAM